MNLLEVKNIKKSFDDLEVLKDISMSVAESEVISILGPSGSGKSTHRQSESMCGRQSQRMRMYTMNCGRYMQRHQMRRKRDIRQAISPIIPESCDVRCVMEQDRLASMCNSCQTWMYHVRNATDHGMGRKHGRSAMRRNRERSIPCHS